MDASLTALDCSISVKTAASMLTIPVSLSSVVHQLGRPIQTSRYCVRRYQAASLSAMLLCENIIHLCFVLCRSVCVASRGVRGHRLHVRSAAAVDQVS